MVKAFAAFNPSSALAPFSFERREVGPNDVQFEILYCGVCHSDLHMARNEWGGTNYPIVPGHEIVGRVTKIGSAVSSFRVGDLAGVGCLVDSCRECASCQDGMEQYCESGAQVFSYNSPDKYLPGKMTYGGYSTSMVVDKDFALHISPKLDLPGVAPLLCAGITTYSPLRHWKVGKGMKVGIVGLGGLGHMGVKFAHAFGAETVLFTTSEIKVPDGKRLGAHEVVISTDEAQVAKHAKSFDFILDTISSSHDLDRYIPLLKRDGTLCLVGVPEHPHPSPAVSNLIFGRRSLAGSLIGGIKETQEMLDYCAINNIVSEVELIPMQQINTAYERMLKRDVKYRFVIDLSSLK